MKSIIVFFVKNLVNATRQDYLVSLFATAKISIFLTPFLALYDKLFKWGFDNQDYIWIVLGAILTDWFFGTIKHIFFTKTETGAPTFSIKLNLFGLFIKIGLVVGGGFLFEGLSHLTREATFVETSLQIITRVIVFMYPAISAWENIYVVSGEKFPPKKWMERIGFYKESSKITDLIDTDNLKK